MKTRAEMLKERAEKEKALKKSVGEEGPADQSKPAPKKVFDCKPCGATCVVDECTKRSNGHIECKECGAPHHPDDVRDAGKVPPLEPAKKPEAAARKPAPKTTEELARDEEAKAQKREDDKAARLPTPPDKYCGACGKILTWAPGVATYFFSCGHNKGDHGIVDDPSQATPPGIAEAIARTNAMHVSSTAPEITAPLVKLNIQWGKSRCPIDRFNAFEVGGFSITVDLHPHEDRVEVGKRLLSDLEKLAEESYRKQKAWYESKLKDLGVGDE